MADDEGDDQDGDVALAGHGPGGARAVVVGGVGPKRGLAMATITSPAERARARRPSARSVPAGRSTSSASDVPKVVDQASVSGANAAATLVCPVEGDQQARGAGLVGRMAARAEEQQGCHLAGQHRLADTAEQRPGQRAARALVAITARAPGDAVRGGPGWPRPRRCCAAPWS